MTVSFSQQPISISNAIPTPIILLSKRQRNQEEDPGQQTDNIVHVTVTASGTVVYTYTATSFSYIPTYSTITDNNSNNSSTVQETSSSTNVGAIVGGVVGGVVFIALIGLIFIKRSRQKKRCFNNEETKDLPFVGGYYEDMVPASQYSLPVHKDSISSGGNPASSQQYQVPNEIDYPRHVPHLKEMEPPHLKD